jgi:hypothetical protein
MRNGRHEEQHELDEDYYDLPDQTNNSSRGGGAGDTKNDDQEDLGEEVDRREVLPRHVRHTRRQKLDEENYEKFQCDIDDTRDDSSRYVVCGTTKKISVKISVKKWTDEKFSRARDIRHSTTEI